MSAGTVVVGRDHTLGSVLDEAARRLESAGHPVRRLPAAAPPRPPSSPRTSGLDTSPTPTSC
ncbi:hypothetical protein [Nocardia coffeae]|uniref:hypothetical protein n=1 Tax=Nocardia coffeae TaxID=2873381 RepID=UPI001F162442|nr:hypothetical protein [Nocardia coffeae]